MPGPNYELKFKEIGPKYSIGVRRPHSVSLSTPDIVGPGTYKPKKDFTTELPE
jgi:hypothetical protein